MVKLWLVIFISNRKNSFSVLQYFKKVLSVKNLFSVKNEPICNIHCKLLCFLFILHYSLNYFILGFMFILV